MSMMSFIYLVGKKLNKTMQDSHQLTCMKFMSPSPNLIAIIKDPR